VLANVTPAMRDFREEIVDPVASLLRFRGEQDVLAQASDTEYGLVTYVSARDQGRWRRAAEALQFGEVTIHGFNDAINLPHGGAKESGIGKDCSHWVSR